MGATAAGAGSPALARCLCKWWLVVAVAVVIRPPPVPVPVALALPAESAQAGGPVVPPSRFTPAEYQTFYRARRRQPCEKDELQTDPGRGQCVPHNCYVFIKTHKTGSSTITSVLHRYGETHMLLPLLPAKWDSSSIGWPHPPHPKNIFDYADGVAYNSLVNHFRFEAQLKPTLFEPLVPGAKFFTIVRRPVDRFISASLFYGLVKNTNQRLQRASEKLAPGILPPLIEGVESTPEALNVLLTDSRYRPFIRNNPLYFNSMAFDLGIGKPMVQTNMGGSYLPLRMGAEQFAAELAALRESLDFVLIMEYFDQSLLLLKRKMCWELSDILYLKLKSHDGDMGSRTSRFKAALTPAALQALERLMWRDAELYAAANQTFWGMVAQEVGFDEELAEFRVQLGRVQERCGEVSVARWDPACAELSRDNLAYVKHLQALYKGAARASKQGLVEELSQEMRTNASRMVANQAPGLRRHFVDKTREPCQGTPREEGATCAPHQCYVFVKTHKTASSTVANILHRFNEGRSLLSVLPTSVRNGNIGWPAEPVPNKHFLGHADGVTYNALVAHVRFGHGSAATLRRTIPGAKFFTILREPLSRSLSALRFYNFPMHTNKRLVKAGRPPSVRLPEDDFRAALEQIASDPQEYFPHLLRSMTYLNSMSYDLGLSNPTYDVAAYKRDDLQALRAASRMVVSTMATILLADRFDESLVLLARHMCWPLEDMVYLKLKTTSSEVAGQTASQSALSHLSAQARQQFADWNYRDVILYEEATKRFEADYAKEAGIEADLERFRGLVRQFQLECGSGSSHAFSEACRLAAADNMQYVRRLHRLYAGAEFGQKPGS